MGNLHLYTNGTLGDIDGIQVSESSSGTPRIILAALRGLTSKSIPICIRSSNYMSYIIKISLGGNNVDKLWISYDGVTWIKSMFFFSIGLTNQVFYMKTSILDDEDYGFEDSNYVDIKYWNQV